MLSASPKSWGIARMHRMDCPYVIPAKNKL